MLLSDPKLELPGRDMSVLNFSCLQATLQAPVSNEESYQNLANDPEKKGVSVSLFWHQWR